MDSNTKSFGHTEIQEFLAFSSPEMRFLVDSSNKQSYITKVEIAPFPGNCS